MQLSSRSSLIVPQRGPVSVPRTTDAFLRRCKRYGYCADDVAGISDLFDAADHESLFQRVLSNELHVLQPLLPDKTNFSYNLRSRHHNRVN